MLKVSVAMAGIKRFGQSAIAIGLFGAFAWIALQRTEHPNRAIIINQSENELPDVVVELLCSNRQVLSIRTGPMIRGSLDVFEFRGALKGSCKLGVEQPLGTNTEIAVSPKGRFGQTLVIGIMSPERVSVAWNKLPE